MHFDKSVYDFVQPDFCLIFVDFNHLVPKIVFHRYGDGCYVLLGSGYYVSSLCHSDLVASPVVVF